MVLIQDIVLRRYLLAFGKNTRTSGQIVPSSIDQTMHRLHDDPFQFLFMGMKDEAAASVP